MKALNKQERNSAIIKFALWLLVSVLIICLPILFSSTLSNEQQSIVAGENENLIEDVNFERDTIAVKIQEIMNLIKSKDANELDADSFNAELMNIFSDITNQTQDIQNWRGDMYRNMVSISGYLISANKIVSTSGENKDKQISELNKIILEFESVKDNLSDLGDERKKKDIQNGVNDVSKEFQKALKMLDNYKSSLK